MIQPQPYRRRAQYYETDQMGVIHHSNYIRWFEEARIDWLRQVGIPFEQFEAEGVIIPVISAGAEYKSMVRFGDEVLVEVELPPFTGAKMAVRYRITDAATGVLRTTGETRHCFLNRAGRPVSLKKAGPRFYEVMMQYAK